MAVRCGDGARLPRASARGARTAAPDVDHWRVGRSRPALRAVRAYPTALPGVLFAQADGQPDHARVRRYRPAVGFPGLRRRGRVAVARDARGAEHRAADARLAAGVGDDPAGAALLLADLP